ncbi:hypothetical protein PPERSA_08383 [Pseudocohnilembus persalinus]|uniref:Transmembrane protein n=1 Tax=Pseudocohnilembus persalinus TaxID=266149 RepID=A0A0V0R670_PSEPJ|nr:hypothetical protein PPERSA_08383 [Pseudocohnilembus persalinus]|eukprot:KRX09982.1 hypothetical protein PPERSA_08383 [Pseudocohnilembus persalinus]
MNSLFILITIFVFYLALIIDIVSLAILDSKRRHDGEFKVYIAFFIIERFLQIFYKIFNLAKTTILQAKTKEYVIDIISTLFFADYAIYAFQTFKYYKEYENWQQNLKNLAQANQGKVPKSQQNKFQPENKDLKLPRIQYRLLFIMRAYFCIVFFMFINQHAVMTSFTQSGGLIFCTLIQSIFVLIAVQETYHFNSELQETIPIKENLFMYLIIYPEMMAILYFWGYFAYQTGTEGVVLYIVILTIIGFCLELGMQFQYQSQIDDKKKKISFFGTQFQTHDLKRLILKPLMIGYELGFYWKYEDVMIKELDDITDEEKTFKNGNLASIAKICIIIFTFIFGCYNMGKHSTKPGFFVMGIIFLVWYLAVMGFYTYFKIIKKQPYRKTFRIESLQFEKNTDEQQQQKKESNQQDKKPNGIIERTKEKINKYRQSSNQNVNDKQNDQLNDEQSGSPSKSQQQQKQKRQHVVDDDDLDVEDIKIEQQKNDNVDFGSAEKKKEMQTQQKKSESENNADDTAKPQKGFFSQAKGLWKSITKSDKQKNKKNNENQVNQNVEDKELQDVEK